jgi:uncharacterized protein YndB with AHSA1/START domain
MKDPGKTLITVTAEINAPMNLVWELWTGCQHIIQWNHASDTWHTTNAENELAAGGRFSFRMEAKDGSFGFDFAGIYNAIEFHKNIEYTIADGRKVKISFNKHNDGTRISESFEAEETNPVEKQREGWQAILDNFKKYAES